ncbi:soluble methane monooxygenase-binding protein MmoD [Methylovirgula sp. HY1]|uniref:soluble methane monooxygenase-binding protein MmoD n=1 Tax=Methylovirgula sp. HY1 TaxID=2822761 RepID=UPI001C74E9E8|nr:soluble methane monooxygenase-binding protein MmoD [Methylovirgula sp. HY1]QXX76071.1 Methane monooxygenase component D [Methylovirgula sp. HY1]
MKPAIFEDESDAAASANWSQQSKSSEMGISFEGAANAPIEIFNDGRYRALVQDLECMWRWEIHRDGQFVQEGCSLSEGSSREAVGHVMSFYRRRDLGQRSDSPNRE